MRAVALYLIALWGWRRLAAAFAAGVLLSFTLPPFNFWPLIFISIPVVIWLMDGIGDAEMSARARARQGFFTGWFFSFGYLLASLYWIGHAFLVDAAAHAWQMPLALVALPMGLAVFAGLAAGLAQLFWWPGLARILVFAGLWAGCEWLRGHVFTGFPWNSLGYTIAASDVLAQAASLFGVYGLSLAVIVAAAFPALIVAPEDDDASVPARLFSPLLSFAVLLGLWGYGVMRLPDGPPAMVAGVNLRIVQPDIPQAEKWKPENRNAIFARLMELSNKASSPDRMGIGDITHLVWPESAVPFLLSENDGALAAIAALLPDETILLTGSLRRRPDDIAARRADAPVYNSVLQIDGAGKIVSAYDKFHLVPLGEYLPFEDVLAGWGFRRLVAVPASFGRGDGPVTMDVRGAPAASPLICYEIIFPAAVIAPGPRPGWLLNVTNDAWFGASIGPHQHLRQARLRAIEEGLPVIRAANTGISAIIDGYGRVLNRLESDTSGVIDNGLPRALDQTVFARFGDLALLALLALTGLAALICRALFSAMRKKATQEVS